MNMNAFGNITNISNPMYGCNGEVNQTTAGAESIVMAVSMFVIIILSMFGNSLVILAIYNFRILREVTYALLCSLAISDFLSPIFRLLPIGIANVRERWTLGCKWCSISSAIGVLFCSSSIVHLCFITVERFVLIHYPLRHGRWLTKRNLIIMISFIWILSLAMALLPYLASTVELTFNRNIMHCEFILIKHPHLSLVMFGVYFGIPLLLMVVVYSQIFNAAIVQTRKMTFNSVGDRHLKRKNIFKQDWKALKVVFVVVGMFLFLWSPYFVVSAIKAYSPRILPYWVSRFALCCAYINSCCNWIVYSVMNRNVRSAFLKLLHIDNTKASKRNDFRLRTIGVTTDNHSSPVSQESNNS